MGFGSVTTGRGVRGQPNELAKYHTSEVGPSVGQEDLEVLDHLRPLAVLALPVRALEDVLERDDAEEVAF